MPTRATIKGNNKCLPPIFQPFQPRYRYKNIKHASLHAEIEGSLSYYFHHAEKPSQSKYVIKLNAN
jgi:hypothetical protein